MTPDEMKVLARVANRNAIENDSPVVVDDSRLIAPINNDSEELPLSLEKLDARLDVLESMQDAGIAKVNQLESALGSALGATDSPVQVLAESLAQTRADVAELKSVSDAMRLTPADVILDVEKPIKLGSVDVTPESTFTTLGTKYPGKTVFIHGIKQLSERPRTVIDLSNDYSGKSDVLIPVSSTVQKINGDLEISSNSNIIDIDMSYTRYSQIESVVADSTTEIRNLSGIINFGQNVAGTYTGALDVAFIDAIFLTNDYGYVNDPAGSLVAGYSFKRDSTSGQYFLIAHVQNGSNTAVSANNTFTNSGLSTNSTINILFNNGHFIKVQFKSVGGNMRYCLVQKLDFTADKLNKIYLINRKDLASGLSLMQLSNIDYTNTLTVFHTASLLKSATESLYRFNEKIFSLNSTGSISSLTGPTYFVESGRLYLAGAGDLATELANGQWIFDEKADLVYTNKTLVDGTPTNYGFPSNGYYKHVHTSGTKTALLKVANGVIVYDAPATETVSYKFAPESGSSAVVSVRLVVKTVVSSTPWADRLTDAEEATMGVNDRYIDSNNKLRNYKDEIILNYDGLYYIFGVSALTKANKLYSISNGTCTLVDGLFYFEIEKDTATRFSRVFFTATAGKLTNLASGFYIDASGRIFKTGVVFPGSWTEGAWSAAAGNFDAAANNTTTDITIAGYSTPAAKSFNQFRTLARMTGVFSSSGTKLQVEAKGGIEQVSAVASNFADTYFRVLRNKDFEIIAVDVINLIARKSSSNALIESGNVIELSSVIYRMNSINDMMMLSKLTEAFVFDSVNSTNLKYVNKNGAVEALAGDCKHYSWPVSGVNSVYHVDSSNSSELIKIANNPQYVNYGTDNVVLLINKQINANVAIDEEDLSSVNVQPLYVLDLELGTISPHPQNMLALDAGRFNSGDYATIRSNNRTVFWKIDNSYNGPFVNSIVSETNGDKYTTDSNGQKAASTLNVNGLLFIDPSNILKKGNSIGGFDDNVSDVKSKYFIDYNGKLSKTSANSGVKDKEITGLNFVLFKNNDNRARLYKNSEMLLVAPGSLVAVSSSAAAQSAEHKHNGLKMWGKDATGMFNRWLDFKVDVARQSNDTSVADVVDMIDYNTGSLSSSVVDFLPAAIGKETTVNHTSITESALTTLTELIADLELISTAAIGGTGNTASIPTDSSSNNGKYYHDTQANLLYKGATSSPYAMAVVTTLTKFISGNGKLYSAAAADGATTAVTSGNVIKVDNKLYSAGADGTLTNVIGYVIKTDGKLYISAVGSALTTVNSGKIISNNILLSSSSGVLTPVTGNVGDRIQLAAGGAGNYRKLNHATSGAVVDLAAGDYVYDTTNSKLYRATAAGTTAPFSPTGVIFYHDTVVSSAFTLNGSKFYRVSANGAIATENLASDQAVWISNAENAITKSIVNAGTVIDTSASAFGGRFRLANNQNCLLNLSYPKWTGNILQKDGSIYSFNTVNGNYQFLIIDGMVQDARAPRGTQVQALDSANVKTWTRVGYSRAQTAANSLLPVAKDEWFSN